MKILIKAIGFIGDNLFATSVVKKLKYKYDGLCKVDLLLSVIQPFELISNDPHIDNVYLEMPDKQYDEIFQLYPLNRQSTPCEQFQIQCGVENPSPEFEIYTNPTIDKYIEHCFKNKGNRKLVAWLSNWEERSFLFTEEEYKRGIDVPNLGYGGKHRDISYIINELEKNNDIILIEVGKPNGTNQLNTDISTVSEYSLTASILKNCDYFIGAEGGLANLASGVGTKTILTGDFVWQLYGPNGVIEKCQDPKLGPTHYFEGHINLDPYLTDEQLIKQINKITCQN
jgi:hypothetical protein